MNKHAPMQAELSFAEGHWPRHQSFSAARSMVAPLYAGCAGWSIAKPVKKFFPEQSSHLQRYSRIFPAVEINSSFYRPHRATTHARWRDSVPDAFRFSVKLPRSITHDSRLKNFNADLAQFIAGVSELRHKLGCLLVQLPPSLQFAAPTARDFFCALRDMVQADIACEPRQVSWAVQEVDELFNALKVVRVAADPSVIPSAGFISCSDMIYIRLHGSPVMYHSSYSNEYLTQLALEIERHINCGQRVWCILDNTASGAAIPNALLLAARLKLRSGMPAAQIRI